MTAAAARERIAREVQRAAVGPGANWAMTDPVRAEEHRRVADYIIAQWAERGGPLVDKLERALKVFRYWEAARDLGIGGEGDVIEEIELALARYRALDAPPQRTVAEVAAEVNRRRKVGALVTTEQEDCVLVPREIMDELAAALARQKEA